MAVAYMDRTDPEIDAEIGGVTLGAYNLNSRTRINGLEEDGISFINTGNVEGNPGYPGGGLGGALLVLDTRESREASVSVTAGAKAANSRIYHLRLQYRTGNDGECTDVVDGQGNTDENRPQDEN